MSSSLSRRSVRDPPSAVSSAIMSRYQTLRRLLIKISYTSPFPPDLFLSSAPPALTLPILSHLFLSYSPHLTAWFLSSGFLLSSSSFSLSSLYGLLHAVFGYHPQLSQQQFSSERGYVERKLQLLCDVLQMCVAKAEELDRERGAAGSGSKGGVPRVAVVVKDKRRSAGEEQTEKSEQRHRQASSSVSTARRQQRREERKEERCEDVEAEEDGGSPQRLQHQHISFTHDDSSQPLSPSHLSPPSHSQHPLHRHSPHSQSQQQSHSAPSSTPGTDPLFALHQQLHRISHRTNQLAHSQQQPNSGSPRRESDSQAAVVERLVERVQAMEAVVRDELGGLRREVQEMRQRLAAVEQRDRERQQHDTGPQVKAVVEETKEAGDGRAERSDEWWWR